jgi:hypothetical protein
MKRLILFTGLLLSALSAQADRLYTYRCKEQLPQTDSEVLRFRTIVTVQETKDLCKVARTKKIGDCAASVTVTIGREDELGGNQTVLKQFSALSVTNDVLYTISAVKKNGFKFYLYLDEYDQAGIELTSKTGQKQKISLSCE